MPELKKDISNTKKEFSVILAKVTNENELEKIRLTFLSRQGKIATLMKSLKPLSLDEKKECGPLLNKLKQEIELLYKTKQKELAVQQAQQENLKQKYFDVSAYSPNQLYGGLTPYSQVAQMVEDIFISMGYDIADGPEVETDYYNFQALNIPENHPARDMQDTFWLDVPGMLLRTQTSPIQIRYMENNKPPIAVIAPGRTYRHEATDASHDFTFAQVEGLYIDKNVSISHLLATIKELIQKIFDSKKIDIRVRPGYFPFVEPAVEVDFSCPFCKSGCSVCKQTRWIELVPGGLVHPNVLRHGGIDPSKYSGFAFGLGLTRLVMLKYAINDIRLLHGNKVDFLQQF
ncbi:phenylalanine--tRNA ligase subunit alpha [bacterium]|jgi:phenylalanyl-tRNA synthetase alpha chain|nr:phenylalanine--tRNA ligase subunit alpha [bacterium]